MLKSEFTSRIGREATDEEFEFANAIYMEFEGDKDEFCSEYAKTAKGKMYAAMSKMIRDQHSGIKSLTAKVAELTEELDHANTLIETIEQNAKDDVEGMNYGMATWLVDVADHKCEDIETQKLLREQAMKLVGERKYYAILMQYGCPAGMDVARIAELLTDTTL